VNLDQRDLALVDPWAASLERSLARRGRRTRTSVALARLRPRDLADAELMHDSLAYSTRRREAAAAASPLPAPAKRGLSLTALLAVTAGPAAGLLATAGSAAAAPAAVSAGNSGNGVKRLQRALGLSPDGVFGGHTKSALRRFQARHGLTVDGVAGPATWSALGRAAASTAVVKSSGGKGKVVGHSVGYLQRLLGLSPDGIFGPQTLRALRSFQARHGLTVDGVAGPATFSALGSASGATHRARTTSDSGGSGVGALQQALGIGADGVFGPGTESALKSWQSSHGLNADGVAGPATRSALGIGDGPALKRGADKSGGGGGGSNSSSKVQAMVAAGNQIATTPYVYGGGHGSFSSSGYDCSGSVSYVLHAAGLLGTPMDSSSLESYGDAGPGAHVTIYANAGHAWMTIDGRRFDTSAQSQTGGSRWSSSMAPTSGYVVRHPTGL
jgi:peptidoglycan hydrolase-like protein with peptidoglycan-binding domain